MLVVNDFLPHSDISLFDTPEFFRLHQGDSDGFYFQWVKKGRALAGVHFTGAGDGRFMSPRRGTFGGLFFGSDFESKDLSQMMIAVIDHLKQAGASSVHVAMAPEWHDPRAFAVQFYVLNALGFKVSKCDLDFGRRLAAAPFLASTSADIRRRNSCEKAEEVEVRRVEDREFAAIYSFIAEQHLLKGYPISMTLEQLEKMRNLFPGRISAYAAQRNDELIAAAICIQIRESMQHIFLMNNKSDNAMYNAVALVVQRIYEDCLSDEISKLSYGTATADRVANDGLIRFKRSLGFIESLKISVSLTI
ncbi:hypothetical protein H4CHR_00770 [Variovorax sp. PBS-H4]|uniref:GNAT family N-acetyltransferase n=1 Tax=Variovorax sp. PBS-H4 TaxID=434008 RepID=UPI001318A917|nr:GNAT family N-acetyltransferase [Variovorax sp. PBS-H4]VTU21354.1 hypothetical protein H4CHR_00770 [Variovorax sp. PBS-H4]